jgi:hypothetical protein
VYSSALRVCFKSFQPGQAKKIISLMNEREIALTHNIYANLIGGFGKLGQTFECLHYWSRYKKEFKEFDINV